VYEHTSFEIGCSTKNKCKGERDNAERNYGKYGLLTKCDRGQDGWILTKFIFCVFMDRDGVEVNKLAKKERSQYPAILTKQAWSIKNLLYGFWGNFSCGTRRVLPSEQDSSILPARVTNHSAGFDSSCPLTELAIY